MLFRSAGVGLIPLSKLRASRLVIEGRKYFRMRFVRCVFMDRLRRVDFWLDWGKAFGPLERGARPHDERGIVISRRRRRATGTLVRIGASGMIWAIHPQEVAPIGPG